MTSANQITFTTSSAFFIVSKLLTINPVSANINMLLDFTNIAPYGTVGDFSIRFYQGVLQGSSTSGNPGNLGDLGNGNYYVNGTFNPNFDTSYYMNSYSIIDTISPIQSGTSYLSISSSLFSRPFIGNVAEFIYYPGGVTNTQRIQIEAYLAQKWGIVSQLSQGHLGLTTRVYRSDYLVPNRVKPTPYYTFFSPRQIPGCSLWMDGADSSTMTQSSSYISAWTSKGTNALSFTQSTSTKQPLLVANVYNGNSIVRCINPGDPVVNVNITTVNNAVLQTGASFCIFIVHNPTIANGSPFCFQNGGGNRISCHLTENGNVIFDTPNVLLTYAAPANYLTSGLKLDVFWSVTNVINYRASGNATASASAGASTWTDGTLTFGSFTPTQTSYYYQTDIGEIIWFNTALALAQVQQVESYLAQKWGLTASIPVGHSHLTQQAGAVTTVANTKFKIVGLPPRFISATGGTITTVGSYKFHTFTYPGGTFTVTANPSSVQALVVGGGGGGGGYYNGGGGGAGGAVYNSAFSIGVGSYTVTVGNGGAGASGGNNPGINGTSGGATTFSTLTGNGGGGGGADNNVNGLTGGCGGGMGPLGASAPGSGNQGYAGGYGTNGPNMGTLGGAYGSGYGGGGGGGMGSVGSNALTSAGPGWGGTGYTYVVGGQNYLVAGGGGGGTADTDNTNFGLGGSSIGGVGGLNSARVAGNGTANTGSGGGGYGRVGTGSAGGSGGTGIVVIAYRVS